MKKTMIKIIQLSTLLIVAGCFTAIRYLPLHAKPIFAKEKENVIVQFSEQELFIAFFNTEDPLAVTTEQFAATIKKNIPHTTLKKGMPAEKITQELWRLIPEFSVKIQDFLNGIGRERCTRIIREKQAAELSVQAFCSKNATMSWKAFTTKLINLLSPYPEYKSLIADLKEIQDCNMITITYYTKALNKKHSATFGKFIEAFQKRYKTNTAGLWGRVVKMAGLS